MADSHVWEIKEEGIIKVIYDYMEYLKDSPKTCTKFETVQWVEERTEYWEDVFAQEMEAGAMSKS